MDDESREAMDLSPEELAARFDAGKPAKVRKSEDFVQRMKRVVDESTAEDEPLTVAVIDVFPFQRRIIRHPARGQSPRSAPRVPVALPPE